MEALYKYFIRPILFRISPERIHNLMVRVLKVPFVAWLTGIFFRQSSADLETEFCGLKFRNPVGLAAGFDKNAELISAWAHLGFGFAEIGTVTPKAQPGNTKPRLFRLKKDMALINRMGFNNDGLEAVAARLKSQKKRIIIGGNIGKNKITPNEEAINDYEKGFEGLYDIVDYFVLNVSSPNTPNLRQLQEKEPLQQLLKHLVDLKTKKSENKPIFLKIAPDLSNAQLDDIIEIVSHSGIDGILATNTTISRDGLKTSEVELTAIGDGGLSGLPLKRKSTEIIKYIHQKSKGTIPIMGIGGIHSPEDALEKMDAGAGLIQLYTGFIYEGPGLITKIIKYLRESHNGQN